MKLITAIIQPDKLDEIKTALAEAGVHGLTVSDASGYGQQRGHTEVYRGAQFTVDLIPKIRLEVLTDDADAERLVGVIVASARSQADDDSDSDSDSDSGEVGAAAGKVGDGKVWVMPLDSVIRVRTGETGLAAL